MKKIKIGDIYSIETKKGLGLLQLVNIPEDKRNGIEMIKVSYQLFSDIPQKFEEIFSDDFFYLRFPVKGALNKGIINLVGHLEMPEGFHIPRFYRNEHLFNPNQWMIVDRETKKMEVVEKLNPEQLKLSSNDVWNDTLLKERLEEGWRLENWK